MFWGRPRWLRPHFHLPWICSQSFRSAKCSVAGSFKGSFKVFYDCLGLGFRTGYVGVSEHRV